MSINQLPRDVLLEIFAYLDVPSALNFSRGSKYLKGAGDQEGYWAQQLKNIGFERIEASNQQTPKIFLKEFVIKSNKLTKSFLEKQDEHTIDLLQKIWQSKFPPAQKNKLIRSITSLFKKPIFETPNPAPNAFEVEKALDQMIASTIAKNLEDGDHNEPAHSLDFKSKNEKFIDDFLNDCFGNIEMSFEEQKTLAKLFINKCLKFESGIISSYSNSLEKHLDLIAKRLTDLGKNPNLTKYDIDYERIDTVSKLQIVYFNKMEVVQTSL